MRADKRKTPMDRKLTRKEKMRARSKHMVGPTVFLILLLTVPVLVSNQAEIFASIGKVRTVITEIVNVTSFVIETILT